MRSTNYQSLNKFVSFVSYTSFQSELHQFIKYSKTPILSCFKQFVKSQIIIRFYLHCLVYETLSKKAVIISEHRFIFSILCFFIFVLFHWVYTFCWNCSFFFFIFFWLWFWQQCFRTYVYTSTIINFRHLDLNNITNI